MPIDVRWGSASHQGRVRDHNEDAVLAGPDVFAVADGMGGHAGGEVASAMAVAALAELGDLTAAADPAPVVAEALAWANHQILQRAASDGAAGMGTTVAGLARAGDGRVLVFNVGDSRVYLLRSGAMHRLTHDHSVVGELVRSGRLTDEEARSHPHRNVITRALGASPEVEPALLSVEVEVGDCFLVASDGLFGEVPDPHICDLLCTPGPLEHRARALVDAALLHGGNDNVSVVLVAVAGVTADGRPTAGDGLDDVTRPSADPRTAGEGRLIDLSAPSRSSDPVDVDTDDMDGDTTPRGLMVTRRHTSTLDHDPAG